MEALLTAGADPNAANEYGGTALQYVVDYMDRGKGCAKAARVLLAYGAEHDAHTAAAMGDLDALARAVAARPASVGESTGSTPLHSAAKYGRLEAAELLLEHGADPNVRRSTQCDGTPGATPLEEAQQHGHPTMVKLLRAHGAVD